MTTIILQVAPHRTAPRATKFVGSIFSLIFDFFAPVRAAISPESPILDVQQARQLADSWAEFDPRSAADLRAACDSYERKNKV
jgi:hypothetical protein